MASQTQLTTLHLCPVSRQPLLDAVVLIPCGHTVNESIAKEIFASAAETWNAGRPRLCPVNVEDGGRKTCCTVLTGYVPNKITREASRLIFNSSPLASSAAAPSYPGESGVFTHVSGSLTGDSTLTEFKSMTRGSLITTFKIVRGMLSPQFRIEYIANKQESMVSYLSSLGLKLNETERESPLFTSSTKKEFQIVFKLVSENNIIPEPYLSQLTQLVEKDEEQSPVDPIVRMFAQMTVRPEQVPSAFPGPKMPLIHKEGNWEAFGPDRDLCRILSFKAQNDEACIQKLKLLGYKQGQIGLSLEINPRHEHAFRTFLKTKGFSADFGRSGFAKTQVVSTIRSLYAILKEHNLIPVDQQPLFEQIIDKGACIPLANDFFMPFPGVISTFVRGKRTWDVVRRQGDCNRSVSFKTTTTNSLITKIKVMGFINNSVATTIYYDKAKMYDLKRYLNSCDIKWSGLIHGNDIGFIRTANDDPKSLKKLFDLLTKIHIFPKEEVEKLKGIIETACNEATMQSDRPNLGRAPDCKTQ